MKKYMPLNGLRWSRDSGSALCGTPPTDVLGQAGGGIKKSLRSITAWEGLLSSEVVCFYLYYLPIEIPLQTSLSL